MSYEEDYLLTQVADLARRVAALEAAAAPRPALPPVNAPKAEWAAHAEAAGVLTADAAAALTKAELVETVKAAEPPPTFDPAAALARVFGPR